MAHDDDGLRLFDFDVLELDWHSGNTATVEMYTWWDGHGWVVQNGLATAGEASDTFEGSPLVNDGLVWNSNGLRRDMFGWDLIQDTNRPWRVLF